MRLVAFFPVALLALASQVASPPAVAWNSWLSLPGIFDLGGPLPDGNILVAGSAGLYTLSPTGALARYAPAYANNPQAEAYFAVSSGPRNTTAGCSFPAGSAYILRLDAPTGITQVDASGQVSQFATFPNTGDPKAIVFDTSGSFGHRLLAATVSGNHTTLYAIDCTSHVAIITRSAPVFEGGMATAPASAGAIAGWLIAPDELSGVIWGISPDGRSHLLAHSGLPAGGDTGVESAAFVPLGFMAGGGSLYYSDRATPGNPHPGNDRLLRLDASQLALAGVRDGDLLAVAEGGVLLIGVRCQPDCRVSPVVGVPTSAHGEGHLLFAPGQGFSPPPYVPRPPFLPVQATIVAPSASTFVLLGLAALIVVALLVVRRRRLRR